MGNEVPRRQSCLLINDPCAVNVTSVLRPVLPVGIRATKRPGIVPPAASRHRIAGSFTFQVQ